MHCYIEDYDAWVVFDPDQPFALGWGPDQDLDFDLRETYEIPEGDELDDGMSQAHEPHLHHMQRQAARRLAEAQERRDLPVAADVLAKLDEVRPYILGRRGREARASLPD